MMRIFTLLFAIILCGSLSAQTVIWGGAGDPNGEFDGGLNDWTAISVSPNDNALWYWDADGSATEGAYAANIGVIASASVANGAASFDSDFLDNAGIQGNFGNGDAAAPQRGELLSPEFSTEGFENVTILWSQYMRQFQSTFSIEVTNDGGATWTSFPIDFNNSVPLNSATTTDSQVSVNVSSAMANQPAVQFKFVYEANYYFWTIDDVAVVETPAVDLVGVNMYYPFNSASVPASMLNSDTLEFAYDFRNNGSMDQTATTVTVDIVDDAGASVFSFSQAGGPIAVGDTAEVVFEDVVLPADVSSNLVEGTYAIVYDVTSADGEDAVPGDNGLAESTTVTADLFAVNQGLSGANSFNSGNYASAMIIRTGELPAGQQYFATDVLFSGADQTQDSIQNAIGNVALFKILNQTGEELTPLEASPNYGAAGDHPNLDLAAFGFFTAEKVDNFSDIPAQLLSTETEELGVALDNNSTYILAIQWDVSNNGGFVFTGSSTGIAYFQTANMVYIPDDPDAVGWYNIAETLAWYMPTVITVVTNTEEETALEEDAVSVYPNPATDRTTVELDFDTPTDASIILRDMRGGYLSTTTVKNVTNQQVEIDLMNLPAGTYSFEIITAENARIVKSFVKVQ